MRQHSRLGEERQALAAERLPADFGRAEGHFFFDANCLRDVIRNRGRGDDGGFGRGRCRGLRQAVDATQPKETGHQQNERRGRGSAGGGVAGRRRFARQAGKLADGGQDNVAGQKRR